MNLLSTQSKMPFLRRRACLLTLLFAPLTVNAQTVTLYGALSNFDVMNDTGQEAYGFEIEIQGVTTIGGSFTGNRYGAPQVVPFAGGVYVRYMAAWDAAAHRFVAATPAAVSFTPTNGHQCVIGTLNYQTSGCEHFGVWTVANPNKTVYRWLLADPNNPGQLQPYGTPVAIPAPVWTVQPPAKPGDAPVVVADIAPPIPPKPAVLYGDAQWVRVYKTENGRQVGLDELVADNPVVPEDDAHLESAWDLIQDKVGDVSNGRHRQNRGALGGNSHAVVRRYEFYKFAGTYDPVTHQALCADGTCTAPAADEVGDFIGAQNAAANLNVPNQFTLTVAPAGNGLVTGTPGSIKCPGTCAATVAPGTAITLTAKAGSGSTFAGWAGPCEGAQDTCTVTLRSDATLDATFVPAFTLSIGRSGKGTVTSQPAGISCGAGKSGACSTKFSAGTVLMLTALPDPGSTWTGWAGACTGTSATCTVAITKDTSVQANFK